MTWGAYTQSWFSEELDLLGSQLSVVIECPVHYPAFNKPLFECMCGVIFPLYLLRAGGWSGDWETIKQKHTKERLLIS